MFSLETITKPADSCREKLELTWLMTIEAFKKLQNDFPDKFYLIQSYEQYAYFTSEKNGNKIRYDFSPL